MSNLAFRHLARDRWPYRCPPGVSNQIWKPVDMLVRDKVPIAVVAELHGISTAKVLEYVNLVERNVALRAMGWRL